MQKLVVITGGNSGIGAEAAKALAAQGFAVTIACRDLAKAGVVRDAIVTAGGTCDVMSLDLGSFRSIRAFAAAFRAKHATLDVLVNNAGLSPMKQSITEDGFEQQLQVNYLGHFLLTQLLLDLLAASGGGRVVHVSSVMHWLGKIDFGSFRGEKRYFTLSAYGQSKLANILFSNELARRAGPRGIVSNAVHPGGVETDIYRELPAWAYALIKPALISAAKGAETIVYLASDPGAGAITGSYLVKSRVASPAPKAKSTEVATKLWDESMRLVGLA
jgi:NAD(P)-dependent dehydrogenase (short-subunit alcohol dehydrogenase family)